MRIPGKSDIIDQLAAETGQPRYDIRQLSHEIILRSGNTSSTWINNDGAKLSLLAIDDSSYRTYELFVQEKNDTDVHHYVYSNIAQPIRYEYPLYSWHPKQKSEETRAQLEKLLLSGPVIDKVPDNHTENKIQKLFSVIARRLVMEHIEENEPGYRTQIFNEILAADNAADKHTIGQKLYDMSVTIGTFTIGPNQFDLALSEAMMHHRAQQRQLTQRTESNE